MIEICLSKEELVLLMKLLETHLLSLNIQIQTNESEIRVKGKNASLKINISTANNLLKKLEGALNNQN